MHTGGHGADWFVTDAVVEALFVRAFGPRIKQHRECTLALKALGIDVEAKLKPSYTADVYEQGMISLRKHLFASEPDDVRALWAMGRETTAGFYRTMIGTAIGAVVKLLPPERMLPRLPANITGSTNYMKATMTQKGPRDFELYVYGSNHAPFVAGAVERGVEQTGCRPKVEVLKAQPLEAWVAIRW
jgi:uncharacterized protein (TIGR02265 family)